MKGTQVALRWSSKISEDIICLSLGATHKYPICFLTNGGGVTEAQKAQQLSNWLGVNVRENQVSPAVVPLKLYMWLTDTRNGKQTVTR